MIWNEDKQETVAVAYGLHHVDYITIIRCKDCKKGSIVMPEGMEPFVTCKNEDHPLDWFCADGERKDNDKG